MLLNAVNSTWAFVFVILDYVIKRKIIHDIIKLVLLFIDSDSHIKYTPTYTNNKSLMQL